MNAKRLSKNFMLLNLCFYLYKSFHNPAQMRILLLPLISLLILVSGCIHENKEADEAFKQATLKECEEAFKKFYAAEFDADDVKVINSKEVIDWIDNTPWKDKELPCEIREVLIRDKGNVDPSPIALDVSGSVPEKGTSMIYIPIRSEVNCESPKTGFFLDDAGKDCEMGMECNGSIGKNCQCICIMKCNAAPAVCMDDCPD